ncbi:hypothetical protein VP01_1050g4 [Puccinia sorghi]|uniref:Uncharacterized protein n=1 Tax=Puccinia sorghi TaxID=27349 RepID=A0A0L6VVJ1_9BASI|nr:hypothetical protein VP01_1050g4 [Puccinia sorghi]
MSSVAATAETCSHPLAYISSTPCYGMFSLCFLCSLQVQQICSHFYKINCLSILLIRSKPQLPFFMHQTSVSALNQKHTLSKPNIYLNFGNSLIISASTKITPSPPVLSNHNDPSSSTVSRTQTPLSGSSITFLASLVFSMFSPSFPHLINIVIFASYTLPVAIALLYFKDTFTSIFEPFPLRFDKPNLPLEYSHQHEFPATTSCPSSDILFYVTSVSVSKKNPKLLLTTAQPPELVATLPTPSSSIISNPIHYLQATSVASSPQLCCLLISVCCVFDHLINLRYAFLSSLLMLFLFSVSRNQLFNLSYFSHLNTRENISTLLIQLCSSDNLPQVFLSIDPGVRFLFSLDWRDVYNALKPTLVGPFLHNPGTRLSMMNATNVCFLEVIFSIDTIEGEIKKPLWKSGTTSWKFSMYDSEPQQKQEKHKKRNDNYGGATEADIIMNGVLICTRGSERAAPCWLCYRKVMGIETESYPQEDESSVEVVFSSWFASSSRSSGMIASPSCAHTIVIGIKNYLVGLLWVPGKKKDSLTESWFSNSRSRSSASRRPQGVLISLGPDSPPEASRLLSIPTWVWILSPCRWDALNCTEEQEPVSHDEIENGAVRGKALQRLIFAGKDHKSVEVISRLFMHAVHLLDHRNMILPAQSLRFLPVIVGGCFNPRHLRICILFLKVGNKSSAPGWLNGFLCGHVTVARMFSSLSATWLFFPTPTGLVLRFLYISRVRALPSRVARLGGSNKRIAPYDEYT